ncbi:Low affinity iron permease [Pseudomonas fluorescens]|nr:Low affinity iron permease [Pseudomonas fluorescens]
MKFARFCQALSNWAGSSKTFLLAIALIGVWALTGPYFHYNDTWQLIINTSTTIITFLMVFRMRPGITPCVTKPAATYAAATPQFHSPAASADA